jgi:hypothetical protein
VGSGGNINSALLSFWPSDYDDAAGLIAVVPHVPLPYVTGGG